MSTLDIILLVLLSLSFLSGLRKGLIRSVGRIIGLIIGAIIATRYYLAFFEWVDRFININESLGKVIAFILVFIVITNLIQLVFYFIEKAFKLVAIIPGSKYINNILGGLLGLLEGALFLGLIFYVMSRYAVFAGGMVESIRESVVVPWLNMVVELILPLLPEALKALQSLF